MERPVVGEAAGAAALADRTATRMAFGGCSRRRIGTARLLDRPATRADGGHIASLGPTLQTACILRGNLNRSSCLMGAA